MRKVVEELHIQLDNLCQVGLGGWVRCMDEWGWGEVG